MAFTRNMTGPMVPLAPQIPGELRLVYLGYTINTSPITHTTRRMIAEEIEKIQHKHHVEDPTVHLAKRVGSQTICKICGTYGHDGGKNGCDNMAMVHNCFKFRASMKRNNDNETIPKIVEKHRKFNEEKLKEAKERKRRGVTKTNIRKRDSSRSRERKIRTTDAQYQEEDAQSEYSEDSWDTTTTLGEE